ncbi:hypothetical protein E8D34_02355 [Nocardioides sp. GY 10113]|uniref:hypothetical protein n=1 Tax=Nocardioides sp. GY 10113 TaxID=2569761 RepID=UPI0010A84DC1|nr:hypothetical protein [Nocardioides sp. GY 10113]TIC88550.1 hypothetical protein E8D34_02355 [Nocardioides sp. GY 10113]
MAGQRRTPDEVEIRTSPREPVVDPRLGIDVAAVAAPDARHRLVTVGDSLTQGFMSGAVHRTDLSWPALVAYELGLPAGAFTFPTYEWPTGPGGLPLDLERLARAMQDRFGERLDFWEIVPAGLWLRGYMDGIEDYWERGPGSRPPAPGPPPDNMGVSGWDLLDPVLLVASEVAAAIARPTRDDLTSQIVEHHRQLVAWSVLQRARDGVGEGAADRTVLEAAAAMSAPGEGIETLVVVLGSNNALGSVVSLEPVWTPEGYADLPLAERPAAGRGCNLWRPSAFAADWAALEAELRRVAAAHVVVATVPSVTIAPIARGVAGKVRPASRYFPYYTRPWISDDDFDPGRDPHLTGEEARAIDSAIDAFNETIVASVAAARRDGLDWYLFDLAALLDRLAARRYIESPWARPAWWTPYELPAALRALDPVPSTRFFRSGPEGRTDGGLFSLDGVHPTTIGYGILAQEVIRVLEMAGVQFRERDGVTPRVGPVEVDFDRLLLADTLVSDPPALVSRSLSLLGWLDERLDWVGRSLPFG